MFADCQYGNECVRPGSWPRVETKGDLPRGNSQSEIYNMTFLACHTSEHLSASQEHQKWQVQPVVCRIQKRGIHSVPVRNPLSCQILLPPAQTNMHHRSMVPTQQESPPLHTHADPAFSRACGSSLVMHTDSPFITAGGRWTHILWHSSHWKVDVASLWIWAGSVTGLANRIWQKWCCVIFWVKPWETQLLLPVSWNSSSVGS